MHGHRVNLPAVDIAVIRAALRMGILLGSDTGGRAAKGTAVSRAWVARLTADGFLYARTRRPGRAPVGSSLELTTCPRRIVA